MESLHLDDKEFIFTANKIGYSTIENCLLFISSKDKKRFLLKVASLKIDKSKNSIALNTIPIDMKKIKNNDIYEYVNYYANDMLSNLFSHNLNSDKILVNVMTKSKTFLLKMIE